MTVAQKVACITALLVAYFALEPALAEAQFMPLGGGGGNMMSQMAPMLEIMKAKLGKRRFAMMMQALGPMMARMMEGGGFGGAPGIGDSEDRSGLTPGSVGVDEAGGDAMGALGGAGSAEMIGMIPQLMQLASAGNGAGHRRRHPKM